MVSDCNVVSSRSVSVSPSHVVYGVVGTTEKFTARLRASKGVNALNS